MLSNIAVRLLCRESFLRCAVTVADYLFFVVNIRIWVLLIALICLLHGKKGAS